MLCRGTAAQPTHGSTSAIATQSAVYLTMAYTYAWDVLKIVTMQRIDWLLTKIEHSFGELSERRDNWERSRRADGLRGGVGIEDAARH